MKKSMRLTPELISTLAEPILMDGYQFYEKKRTSNGPARVVRGVRVTESHKRATEIKAIHEAHLEMYYRLENMHLNAEFYTAYLANFQIAMREQMREIERTLSSNTL